MSEIERHYLDVVGVPMHWHEAGRGPAVVLIHGMPTSPTLWRHLMPLVRGARTLAWEMIGYGESMPQGRERDISVRHQALYLLTWLDALEIERAILVGHGLGGGVAQLAAVERPQKCAALMLANSIAYDSWPTGIVKAIRAGGAIAHLPSLLVKAVFGALVRGGHDDRRQAAESVALHWAPYAKHGAGSMLVHEARGLDVRDMRGVTPGLRGLDMPARVVWGAKDPYQRVGYGERLAEDLGTSLRRIEHARHFTPEDHPEALAEIVNELVVETQQREPAQEIERDAGMRAS